MAEFQQQDAERRDVRGARRAGGAETVFDRPEQNNPMNDEWRNDFKAALEGLRYDNEVAVVIVKGNGRSLSSGGDLQALNSVFGNRSRPQNSFRIGRFLYRTVWQHQAGHPSGARLLHRRRYLADGRLGRRRHRRGGPIGSPEARALGFKPFLGFWALTLGPRWAKLLLFSGDSIDGRTAEQIGMVTKAVPHDDLEPYVEVIARRIATLGVETLSIQKEAVNGKLEILGMEAIMKSTMVYNHLAHSTDRAGSFLEKIRDDGIREAVSWRDGPFGGAQRMGGPLPILDGPPKDDAPPAEG